ncbi:MAG: hypothetical protein ACR2MX_11765 [Cyclobacteriaceae bacterium]
MKHFPKITLLLLLSGLGSGVLAQSAFDKMTNEKMGKILHRESKEVEGESGRWQVAYLERMLYIITDENANRMRVMTPIIEEAKMAEDSMKKLLEANFDRALDAKYSLYEGYVWSVFTHPLSELTVEQFKDAMKQVATLADRYGSTYSSTDFVFGGQEQSEN